MADLRGMPADLSRFYPPPLTLPQLRAGHYLGWGGPDEPADLDPLVDFKRALELTGEKWLSFSEAVALLREREPAMSIGQAEAIIGDLRAAYFADGGPFARQSGKSTAVRFQWFRGGGFFPLKEPNSGNTFVSMGDLIYWHDRSTAVPEPAPSSPAPTAEAVEQHTSPTVDRATIAIDALYPQGVPTQATLGNKQLIADVNAKLASMNLQTVSETSVLRAAGRRKK
jgi:hypothetical protein